MRYFDKMCLVCSSYLLGRIHVDGGGKRDADTLAQVLRIDRMERDELRDKNQRETYGDKTDGDEFRKVLRSWKRRNLKF